MAVGKSFLDQYSVFCVFGSVVGCVVVPLITQVCCKTSAILFVLICHLQLVISLHNRLMTTVINLCHTSQIWTWYWIKLKLLNFWFLLPDSCSTVELSSGLGLVQCKGMWDLGQGNVNLFRKLTCISIIFRAWNPWSSLQLL